MKMTVDASSMRLSQGGGWIQLMKDASHFATLCDSYIQLGTVVLTHSYTFDLSNSQKTRTIENSAEHYVF